MFLSINLQSCLVGLFQLPRDVFFLHVVSLTVKQVRYSLLHSKWRAMDLQKLQHRRTGCRGAGIWREREVLKTTWRPAHQFFVLGYTAALCLACIRQSRLCPMPLATSYLGATRFRNWWHCWGCPRLWYTILNFQSVHDLSAEVRYAEIGKFRALSFFSTARLNNAACLSLYGSAYKSAACHKKRNQSCCTASAVRETGHPEIPIKFWRRSRRGSFEWAQL